MGIEAAGNGRESTSSFRLRRAACRTLTLQELKTCVMPVLLRRPARPPHQPPLFPSAASAVWKTAVLLLHQWRF